MKRGLLICLALCLAVMLCACGKTLSNVYDVERGGKIYTVDKTAQTITVDGYVCHYTVSGNGDGGKFNVTYPDGSSYWWGWSGNAGYGGSSSDYDATRYVPGNVLLDVLMEGMPEGRERSGHPFFGFLFIVVGILNVAAPQAMWYLSDGWKYKDAEPSDAALTWGRVGGVFAILIGVICMFV